MMPSASLGKNLNDIKIISFVCVDHDFAFDCENRQFFLIERYILLGIFERENYAHNILETVFW